MTKNEHQARKLAITAVVLTGMAAALWLGLAIAIAADPTYDSRTSLGSTARDFLMAAAFATVGSVITIKRPGSLIGWAMLLSGSGVLTGSGLLRSYAEFAIFAQPEARMPLGVEAAAISGGGWTPLMAGVFLLILLFPSGRVPSPRWRPVAYFVLGAFALIWVGLSTYPVGPGAGEFEPPFEGLDHNPLAFASNDSYVIVLFVLIGLCLASIAAAAIDLFFRFLRSRGAEREQFKWLAFAAGLIALSLPFGGTRLRFVEDLANIVFAIGIFGLPVAVGIAVLRYRLYEIDRIINRTLVYGLLTAMLAAAYFCLVVGLQALLRSVSGGSDLAIALTTLVIAALFLPARRRVQILVDRRFNRRAYDAAKTVDAFSARLREQIDLDTLRYELLAVVNETMQPSRASLWLQLPEDGR